MSTDVATRLLVLGDSFSCGEGVGVRTRVDQTWAGLVAARLRAGFDSLATPGARIRDVRTVQLPQARPASVVTLLIGLNDVIRGGFDTDQFAADLDAVVGALLALDPERIVLARLHDPTALFPMPERLRLRFTDRIDAVNAAVDPQRAEPRITVLDLAGIDGLRRREAWAVDRIHPGTRGHRYLADAVVALLERDPVPPPHSCGDVRRSGRLTIRPSELHWLVRHGLPWLMGNLGQVVVPVAEMFLGGREEHTGPPQEPLFGRGVPG